MKSFHKELAIEFPKMPDSFRERVSSAVAQQLEGAKNVQKIRRGGVSRRVFPVSKLVIPVAACLVLVCGTAAAANLPVFKRWLASLGANEQIAEELLIQEAEEKNAIEQGNLFTVTDAYFDGVTLMFWATPGETLDTLDFGDHVFINGSDSRLEYVVETEEGSGVYECKVTVMDENLMNAAPDTLEVRLSVYMDGAGKEETAFCIASDKLRTAEKIEDQVIELSYGQVEVCGLKVAPSAVSFCLKWKVYSEEIHELIYIPDYFVEDSAGKRCLLSEIMRSAGVSPDVYDASAGCWEFVQDLEFTAFDSTSEYMILIPCECGYDEAGNPLPGTETAREDMSFKIMLR